MKTYQITKDIRVLYVPATSFPDGIQAAFENLRKRVPAEDDRILFGISWPDEKGNILYKAAAEEKQSGETAKYGVGTFTIKKGIYVSELIKDYKKNISKISVAFQRLLHHPKLDTNSYCLEWYKGNDDVLCMVKLNQAKEGEPEQEAVNTN